MQSFFILAITLDRVMTYDSVVLVELLLSAQAWYWYYLLLSGLRIEHTSV